MAAAPGRDIARHSEEPRAIDRTVKDARRFDPVAARRGYDLDGEADGVIETKTKLAISDFQSRSSLSLNGRAYASALAAMQGR